MVLTTTVCRGNMLEMWQERDTSNMFGMWRRARAGLYSPSWERKEASRLSSSSRQVRYGAAL